MNGGVKMIILPEKLQAARLRLLTERPYLATALYSLVPVERRGLGTLAVDKWWRLYFDPEAVTTWDVRELAGVLYHEVTHLLRAHHERFEHADRETANVAADIEINDDVREEGVRLPEGALYPETFGFPEGLLAEEYYSLFQQQGQQSAAAQGDGQGNGQRREQAAAQGGGSGGRQQGGDTAAQGGNGTDGHQQDAAAGGERNGQQQDAAAQGGGDGAGGQDGQQRGAATQDGGGQGDASQGSSTGKPAPGCGRCGSCAHGHREAWEHGSPEESGVPGVSATEAEIIRRQVAQEIVRIAQQSKERGTIPQHWHRWAEERLRPKVDWRRQLRAAVRAALATVSGAADYSYRKLPRRRLPNIVTPGLVQPVPEVAVVVDTSGSMSDDLLARALAEVQGVLRATGVHGATVLTVDAAVHTVQRVFDARQVRPVGGGGTDMRVGIDAALKLRPRPHVVVVLTDGYTPWGDVPVRGVKVVAGIVGGGNTDVPDWVQVVQVREE
jgi:predicted metal-dependent peptidase